MRTPKIRFDSTLIVILFCSLFATSTLYADKRSKKGREVAEKSRETNRGYKGETANVTLVIIGKNNAKKVRSLLYKAKETKDDSDKTLFEFKDPPDVAGTKLLTWSHISKDNDQWLYLPGLRKIKRITSRNKTGSFLGSEFTYEDLTTPEVDKYKYKYLKKSKAMGRDAYIVERYPKDENSGYSRQIVYFDAKHYQPLKIEYYDREPQHLKTAKFEGYKKIKGFWRAEKVSIVNKVNKKKSSMTWTKRKLKKKISNQVFDSRQLDRS